MAFFILYQALKLHLFTHPFLNVLIASSSNRTVNTLSQSVLLIELFDFSPQACRTVGRERGIFGPFGEEDNELSMAKA
jgi:hypothetical protein